MMRFLKQMTDGGCLLVYEVQREINLNQQSRRWPSQSMSLALSLSVTIVWRQIPYILLTYLIPQAGSTTSEAAPEIEVLASLDLELTSRPHLQGQPAPEGSLASSEELED
jgi:hypothetical protein